MMVSKSLRKNRTRPPLVSVIILNYNGLTYLGTFLKKCLDSVIGCNYPYLEVIFVDNGSNDGSAVFVEETYGDKILVIKNEQNLGCAEGFNAGIEASKGEYVVTLPNDLVVDRDWLKPIVNLMESDPQIGLAGCKRMRYGTRLFDAIGAAMYLCGRLKNIGAGEVDRGQYDSNIYDIDFIGVQIIRRNVIEQVGLFDPGVFTLFFRRCGSMLPHSQSRLQTRLRF